MPPMAQPYAKKSMGEAASQKAIVTRVESSKDATAAHPTNLNVVQGHITKAELMKTEISAPDTPKKKQ